MLRSTPPDRDPLRNTRGMPVPFNSPGVPSGEDGIEAARRGANSLENRAAQMAAEPEGATPAPSTDSIDFLHLVREAENQASLYIAQVNRRAWSQSYRAFHNEHFVGSKYTRPEWRGRSKLFVPKTRAAVRKDNAAVAASLFNNIDAINCLPGNEADPKQKAAASVMEQLVNYRTDRSSQKGAFPWFLLSMGARQDAVLTGVCASKQYWKQDYRRVGEEKVLARDEDGALRLSVRDRYKLEIDRPDMLVFPPENYIVDPSAEWTNPAQSAAFFILKYPMQIEEVRAKQNAPINPWNPVPDEALKNSVESGTHDMAAIRRAREMGIDRMDETQTGTHFQIIWVYESFIRTQDEDYNFYSIGDQYFLTDPRPTRDVYPEQFGERPLALGYGNLESHRIYPMSPAESWQPLQMETNDLRNLMLDATKQNVMPVTKVMRGRQVDLDQVRRRSSGSAILVTSKDDVTWETPPQIPQTSIAMSRELDLELDDLAGQQNYGSVETNNALGKTLGGLKLAAGAANAVQEFDIRVWIETWVAPALTQIVRLEQYYESDPVVLGIAGAKAQLFEKYGINKIDDDLLEQDVTVRVSVGLGAGDPMQRLQKFQSAASIVAPLLAQTKEFQSGQVELDWEALVQEVFGAAGYKDGGQRFFKKNPAPAANPMADLKSRELQSKITKNEQTGKAAMFSGIAALAKVALGKRELEAEVVDRLLGRQHEATRMGAEHGHRSNDQHLSAVDHGHRHGLALAAHRHQVGQAERDNARADAEAAAAAGEAAAPGGEGGTGSTPVAPEAPQEAAAPQASPNPTQLLLELLRSGKLEFTRKDGKIAGVKMAAGANASNPYPEPAASGAPPASAQPPATAPSPMASAPPPQNNEKVLARLAAIEGRLSRPRRIIRDPKTNHIVGVE